MLPCIACKKHVQDDADEEDDEEDEEEDEQISGAAKAQVKSLSSQLKDVVLKVSAAYRQCRPCASSSCRSGNEHELTGTSSASSSADEWKIGKSGTMVQKNKNSTGSSTSDSKESSSKVSASSSSVSVTNINTNGNGNCQTPRTQQPQQVDENGCQEWVAQVEPGVLITFIALPNGENELKRIRFSRDMFNKWQAESWWAENCERVHELYNVAGNDHSFPNSKREKGEASSSHDSTKPQDQHQQLQEHSFAEAASLAKSKHDTKPSAASAAAVGGSSDELTEWVEEDEPGVYITVKLGPNGNRELKRVRFSREKFSERQAKLWWERNRFRIHDHYL